MRGLLADDPKWTSFLSKQPERDGTKQPCCNRHVHFVFGYK